MYILLTALLSYILGAIPTALIIGKVFFKKDIREYGSGNLGGSNSGRVFGKKIGVLVIALDHLKAIIAIILTKLIISHTNPDLINLAIYISSAFVIIGHCYTCFAKFKGGKAVASLFGVLFATSLYLYIVVGLLYLAFLKATKYVSLTSILDFYVAALLSLIPFFRQSLILNLKFDLFYSLVLLLSALFVTYRHRSNIKRLKNHSESKIKWM